MFLKCTQISRSYPEESTVWINVHRVALILEVPEFKQSGKGAVLERKRRALYITLAGLPEEDIAVADDDGTLVQVINDMLQNRTAWVARRPRKNI